MNSKLPANLLPLIDGDWIVYLACQAVEYHWDEEGEDPPFHNVVTVLEDKLNYILQTLETTVEPIFFFTGADNFRKDIATTKVYKGNRSSEKPFHYQNLITYIESRYPTIVTDNLEADDSMAIYQTEFDENKPFNVTQSTCIVTVDKDLRQVGGWHFSPEGYNYPSFGPVHVTDDNCWIKLSKNRKKVVGTGYKFFYAQLLTGDTVDNIPGCPHTGPVKAMKILGNATTKGECYEAVREAYRAECWCPDEYLKEQADLLWMVREVDMFGEPVLWEPPND